MKIKLTPADVISAINAHITATGINLTDKTITYAFHNRRSKGGIFAEVTISGDAESPVIDSVVQALTQTAVADVPEQVESVAVQQNMPLFEPAQEAPVDAHTEPTPVPSLFS